MKAIISRVFVILCLVGQLYAGSKYEELAKKGDREAQFSLYLELISKDPSQADKWLKKSAEQGLARSQYFLGCNLLIGEKANPPEALRWFFLASKGKGDDLIFASAAKFKIGVYFCDTNKTEAFRWFSESARTGNKDALFEVAQCKMSGVGSPKDFLEAYGIFNYLAPENEEAAKKRDELEKIMSSQQIADAQRITKIIPSKIESAIKSLKD